MYLAYWLVLFSTASFANVLGLNVSSAFKYAVTVYILIPILLIPQLILGGVVVKFDDLHPELRSHDKVPLVGEIMTSRWAYEALIVYQFRANAYQKHYFEDNQIRRDADYKTIYYIPTLDAKLVACRLLLDQDLHQELEANLQLLRHEIGKELQKVGTKQFPGYQSLTVEAINVDIITEGQEFLAALKRYYINRRNDADARRAATDVRIKNQLKDPDALVLLTSRYENETIEDMVLNEGVDRIVEEDGRLIQKIYPIFMLPEPGVFNFRSQFLVAYKSFFGAVIPTYGFNVLVIWLMTTILFIMLFYDVLGRLIYRN
jgi:hypothetical protein